MYIILHDLNCSISNFELGSIDTQHNGMLWHSEEKKIDKKRALNSRIYNLFDDEPLTSQINDDSPEKD